jgi:hypothetical protein
MSSFVARAMSVTLSAIVLIPSAALGIMTAARRLPQECSVSVSTSVLVDIHDRLSEEEAPVSQMLIVEGLPETTERLVRANPEESAYDATAREIVWVLTGTEVPLVYTCSNDPQVECAANRDCRCAAPSGCPTPDATVVCVGAGSVSYEFVMGGTAPESFGGNVQFSRGDDSPEEEAAVGGSTSLICNPSPVQAQRIAPESCTAGDLYEVVVNVSLTGATPPSMTVTEALPLGWELRSSDPPASLLIPRMNQVQWSFAGSQVASRQIRYSLEVPTSTVGQRQITGVVQFGASGEVSTGTSTTDCAAGLPTPTATGSRPPAPTATSVPTPTPTGTQTVGQGVTASPTSSRTASATSLAGTATAVPGSTPTARPTEPTPAACIGDCNGNRRVTVDELVRGVSIALSAGSLSLCPAFDANGDGVVVVSELVTGVNALLRGCS